MTAANYKPSLSLTLSHEGGYVNHPKDPGGATNQGVTQAVYDAYRKVHGQPLRSVKHIIASEVEEIYRKQYWRRARGDDLPCGLDYAVFDFAVNSGVARAVRYLQRLVGVNDDAVIGDITLAAVFKAAEKDEELLIANYCSNRMAFLRSLGTFATFGKGWTRRVIGYEPGIQSNDNGVLDYATFMALKDLTYSRVMPTEIGAKPGEVSGKAIAPLDGPWPERKLNYAELKGTLSEINDQLAGMIEAS